MYRSGSQIEYQDGLPIIDAAGEADPIFSKIAHTGKAAAHFDRCVTLQNEAEGEVSDAEYCHLENNASNAGELMMVHARYLTGQPRDAA
jgi:hypothetical protein